MAVSVVGFDIGYQSSYVAVARCGGIETIANEYSDRCTPTCVSFSENTRCIGAAAKQQLVTNPKNTLCGFTKLLGKKFNDPTVQAELPFVPYKVVEVENGRIGIEVQYMNEAVTLTPEQIVAMQLTKLKDIAEINLGTKVVDIVVNVPTYSTDAERRAMLDAAQIAGLNCVKLLNDTTAVAIAYGLYNQDLPEPDAKPRHVVFVDMGHFSLQVSIVAFNKGKMKVIATACDPKLGGRDFDYCIFNKMVEEFQERYHLKVRESAKASLRLMQECEKLKKLMSANSTDIPLNIECFMEDKDVSARMKRVEFEALATPHFVRLEDVLRRVLTEANLTTADITAVELVGGCTRVPAVKLLVAQVFAQEAKTSLNADEAVARGCALQCAILSPAFRVKEFAIADAFPYSISLNYEEPNGPNTLEVFSKWHAFPFSRQLTFSRKEAFNLEAKYTKVEEIYNHNATIGTFRVNNVVPTATGESSTVKVKLRINTHGVFTISQAQLVEKVEKQVEVDVEPAAPAAPGTTATDPTTAASPEQAPKTQPMETDESSSDAKASPTTDQPLGEPASPAPGTTEVPLPQQQPEANQANPATGATTTPAAAPGKKLVTKLVSKNTDLPMQAVIMQYAPAKINEFAETESQMIAQNRLESERSHAKNALEEYVYEMRDKLFGAFDGFVTDTERDGFASQLTMTEEWLYDEGADVSKQVYLDRMATLRPYGELYETRVREAAERPLAVDEFARLCVTIQKALESNAAGEDQYKHWDSDEVNKLRTALEEKQRWFNHESNLQNAKKSFDDPVLTASRIRVQKQSLEAVCNPILTKPKPVVEPPKPAAADPVPNATDAPSGSHTDNGSTTDSSGTKVPPSSTDNCQPNGSQGSTGVADKKEDMDLD